MAFKPRYVGLPTGKKTPRPSGVTEVSGSRPGTQGAVSTSLSSQRQAYLNRTRAGAGGFTLNRNASGPGTAYTPFQYRPTTQAGSGAASGGSAGQGSVPSANPASNGTLDRIPPASSHPTTSNHGTGGSSTPGGAPLAGTSSQQAGPPRWPTAHSSGGAKKGPPKKAPPPPMKKTAGSSTKGKMPTSLGGGPQKGSKGPSKSAGGGAGAGAGVGQPLTGVGKKIAGGIGQAYSASEKHWVTINGAHVYLPVK